ncbi:MAG: polysaccharide biosynthesis C-terminal domain-containing protein [Bacteroidota bacterium]|nr:polysaccharide biosynthesis C-terminal domain-containing protein [Bacteroidota bacterium]
MSKHQFLPTIIGLIIVNLVIKAIFIFGVDMQVQHQVGQSTYGLYFTLLNLCYIFQIINDFGLNLLHNTDTAVHGKVRVERYYQILRLKVILALFYSGVVGMAAYALGYGDMWKLLIWLVVNNILVSLIMVLRAGISGMGNYKTEAMVSVMDKALMIVICGGLLLSVSEFKIEWFVLAQTASLVITVIIAFFVSLKYIDRSPTAISLSPMEVVFRDTLPYTVATLLMFVYTRSDSILIEKLMPDGAFHVGVYAAAYRLLDASNMIAYLFSPLLIPMYAKLMNNRQETLQLLRLSSGLMICMTGLIGWAGFWWGAPIMNALYPSVDATWIMTFRLLILSHIPIGLMYIFSSYLTAVFELRKQNILFLIAVMINIGLNLYLIPIHGTVGAAIAALVTQSFTATGLILIGRFHLGEKTDYQRFGSILIYFAILIVGGWLLESTTLPWLIEIAIFFFVAVLAGFLFRIMDLQAFKEMAVKRVTSIQ